MEMRDSVRVASVREKLLNLAAGGYHRKFEDHNREGGGKEPHIGRLYGKAVHVLLGHDTKRASPGESKLFETFSWSKPVSRTARAGRKKTHGEQGRGEEEGTRHLPSQPTSEAEDMRRNPPS